MDTEEDELAVPENCWNGQSRLSVQFTKVSIERGKIFIKIAARPNPLIRANSCVSVPVQLENAAEVVGGFPL